MEKCGYEHSSSFDETEVLGTRLESWLVYNTTSSYHMYQSHHTRGVSGVCVLSSH